MLFQEGAQLGLGLGGFAALVPVVDRPVEGRTVLEGDAPPGGRQGTPCRIGAAPGMREVGHHLAAEELEPELVEHAALGAHVFPRLRAVIPGTSGGPPSARPRMNGRASDGPRTVAPGSPSMRSK
jgi:hypothetical protein